MSLRAKHWKWCVIYLKNCWVGCAGEWELLWLIRWGMRIVVVGGDLVLKTDSFFFYQERWGQDQEKCEGHCSECKNFLFKFLWLLPLKKKKVVCIVGIWGTEGTVSYAVVREKGMQLCNHYVVWAEKGYFMLCSILFCSWFEVRMVLWPLPLFTYGYESHLTIRTSRLCEGNAIGAFVPTNTYIVLQGGGLNDATYVYTNFGPSCMALLEFFFRLLLSLCKSWHGKVISCNVNPSILLIEPWINSDAMR